MTTSAFPEQPIRGRAHDVSDVAAMEVLVYDYDRAAAALGVSTSFLRKQVMAGRIMHNKLGRSVRFTRAHLDAYLAATEQPMVVRPRRRRL
jgi:excisionase family DNA binding protein